MHIDASRSIDVGELIDDLVFDVDRRRDVGGEGPGREFGGRADVDEQFLPRRHGEGSAEACVRERASFVCNVGKSWVRAWRLVELSAGRGGASYAIEETLNLNETVVEGTRNVSYENCLIYALLQSRHCTLLHDYTKAPRSVPGFLPMLLVARGANTPFACHARQSMGFLTPVILCHSKIQKCH